MWTVRPSYGRGRPSPARTSYEFWLETYPQEPEQEITSGTDLTASWLRYGNFDNSPC